MTPAKSRVIGILCIGCLAQVANCRLIALNHPDNNFILSSESEEAADIDNFENVFASHEQTHNPDEDLSTPELLTKYGYPAETHEVITQDGYVLTLHRIPHGRANPSVQKRSPILLHHGLLCSSVDWIMNTVDKALGYRLADLGYDVWLANSRGNTYSRKHVSLTPDQPVLGFQVGYYDLPAYFDYILATTGEEKLHYVGHSQGTVVFWIAMSEHPEYNDKIHAMFGMGPVAFLNGTVSPIRYLADVSTQLEEAEALFGDREFLPNNGVLKQLNKLVCENKYLESLICENIMFLLCGFDKPQMNETTLPVVLAHTPAGTSSHTVIHFAQLMKSGKFRQFDFGKRKNLQKYGSEQPPEYDLSKVTAKVALYYGQNDWLAVPSDVVELSRALPNVMVTYKVDLEAFNHLDFLYAIDINKLLYDDLIHLLVQS